MAVSKHLAAPSPVTAPAASRHRQVQRLPDPPEGLHTRGWSHGDGKRRELTGDSGGHRVATAGGPLPGPGASPQVPAGCQEPAQGQGCPWSWPRGDKGRPKASGPQKGCPRRVGATGEPRPLLKGPPKAEPEGGRPGPRPSCAPAPHRLLPLPRRTEPSGRRLAGEPGTGFPVARRTMRGGQGPGAHGGSVSHSPGRDEAGNRKDG